MTRRTRESLLVVAGAVGVSLGLWWLAFLAISYVLEVLR